MKLHKGKLYPIIALLALCLILTACSLGTQPGPENNKNTGAGLAIELTGADGTSTKLTLADLEKMPAVTGKGSFKKSTGTIEGPFEYKGVKLRELLNRAGAADQNGIEVVASDGYSMTYTAEQIDGEVMTYDSDGQAQKPGGTTAVLAYEMDGQKDFEGIPRIVFLAEENVITDGHLWARDVQTIKVLPEIKDWVITLKGIEEAKMDRATYESAATCPDTQHPAQTYEFTGKEGKTSVYEGIPLWVLISMIDGADPQLGHYRFNDDLARKGYKIKVISKDGYSVELESQLVARNSNIIAAYKKDGSYLPPDEFPLTMTGADLPSKKYMVKQIAEIQLIELPNQQ